MRNEQIETLHTQIGTLLTVPLRVIPDPLALTQIERLTLTLLLPQLMGDGTGSELNTLATRTSHRRGGGGARQQYETVVLHGTVQVDRCGTDHAGAGKWECVLTPLAMEARQ